MKAVIDIGSNSVRLMLIEDDKSSKYITTTKLSAGQRVGSDLLTVPMERTIDAIAEFVQRARECNSQAIYIFATEAVRSSANRKYFVQAVYDRVGIRIDVLDSITEANCGFFGVGASGMSMVIDIGGASTELIVGNAEGVLYAKSIPIGIVRVRDCASRGDNIVNYIAENIALYKDVPQADTHYIIGGTAGTVVAMRERMEIYDMTVTDGYRLTKSVILEELARVRSMSIEDRCDIIGLDDKRADTIAYGMDIMLAVMNYVDIDSIIVSEKDNLEGYLYIKEVQR